MSNRTHTPLLSPVATEGPGASIVPCPVCLEQGKEVPMVKGQPTTFYFYYRCPACGNLALVERGE